MSLVCKKENSKYSRSPADQIIADAKRYGRKGDFPTYNFHKRKLILLNLTSDEFEEKCKKLARELGV